MMPSDELWIELAEFDLGLGDGIWDGISWIGLAVPVALYCGLLPARNVGVRRGFWDRFKQP